MGGVRKIDSESGSGAKNQREMSMTRSRILTFFNRIGLEPDWDLVPERSGADRTRIAMSRDCQLKYAIL